MFVSFVAVVTIGRLGEPPSHIQIILKLNLISINIDTYQLLNEFHGLFHFRKFKHHFLVSSVFAATKSWVGFNVVPSFSSCEEPARNLMQ